MKIIFSKKAFTLIELIVALLLIAVMVLGIFSISSVLNNNNQDYGQRYLVRSETQTTLNHILNNASLAVGSGALNDEGILPGVHLTHPDRSAFCIHQGPNNNLIGSTSDIWLCYSLSNNQINWCAEPYVKGTTDPRGANSCTYATNFIPNPATGANTTFLGTAYSDYFYNNITTNSEVYTPPSFNNNGIFTITIQNCLDDTASSCYNSTVANQDPANNPQVQVTGSVSPGQVSTST